MRGRHRRPGPMLRALARLPRPVRRILVMATLALNCALTATARTTAT